MPGGRLPTRQGVLGPNGAPGSRLLGGSARAGVCWCSGSSGGRVWGVVGRQSDRVEGVDKHWLVPGMGGGEARAGGVLWVVGLAEGVERAVEHGGRVLAMWLRLL